MIKFSDDKIRDAFLHDEILAQLLPFPSAGDCLRSVLRREGVWGLYRSMPTTLVWRPGNVSRNRFVEDLGKRHVDMVNADMEKLGAITQKHSKYPHIL